MTYQTGSKGAQLVVALLHPLRHLFARRFFHLQSLARRRLGGSRQIVALAVRNDGWFTGRVPLPYKIATAFWR